jgi:hypothetical protein
MPPTPKTKPVEPEYKAVAVVKRGTGHYSLRTLLIQGDRVIAYEDTEPDLRRACVSRGLLALGRDD